MSSVMLEVARELQAVCRPNPSKSRASCTRDYKLLKAKAKEKSANSSEAVCAISSDSDVEFIAEYKQNLAMDHFLPSAGVEEGSGANANHGMCPACSACMYIYIYIFM